MPHTGSFTLVPVIAFMAFPVSSNATSFSIEGSISTSGRCRRRCLAKLAGLKHQPNRHPLRILVDVASSADRKSKSRWTQALRFAWRERSNWKDPTECLRANGGVAGCAQKFADLQAEMRTPPGLVRLGGEDRFPKIPFFVGVELLDRYGDWR